jgi:hypothetical protein
MSARSQPYPPPGCAVRIPALLWQEALTTMRAYATRGGARRRRGSEALIYFGGIVAGDEMIATTLYRLDHAPQGDRVVVTREEARWLLRELQARDDKLLAQLHSHRGLAGHSPGDDAHATSFHDGFLSIVVPFFGRGVVAPAECAVLEYRTGDFVELDAEEIERRIHVYEAIVERSGTTVEKEQRWRAFARRLKSIARKPR